MKPDIYELNVSTGDRILLCSDGICTMIEDHEIESIMAHSASAQDCADALVEAALAAGGYDNATAVVVDVEGSREAQERKAAKKSKAFIATIIAVVLVAFGLAGFGAWQYVDHSAYLVEQDGKVAVYRGLNDQILGVSFPISRRRPTSKSTNCSPGWPTASRKAWSWKAASTASMPCSTNTQRKSSATHPPRRRPTNLQQGARP